MENNISNSQVKNNEQQGFGGGSSVISNVKLSKASKIASIGMGAVAVSTVISLILSYILHGQMQDFFGKINVNSNLNTSAISGGTFISIALVVLFFVLALRMKNTKSKTLPIVLIVFSSIFLVLSVIGLSLVATQMSIFETATKATTSALSSDAIKSFDSIKQTIMMSYIPSVIAIAGWGITLFGSIMANTAIKEEIMQNN